MSTKPTTIFLDANILYSRTLRDWMWLLMIESGKSDGRNRIDPRVSEDVLAEMTYRIRRANPTLSDAQVGGIRGRLLEGQPENVVVRGYDVPKVPSLRDPNDLHLVAAAAHAKVDYLVTEDCGIHDIADEFEFETYTADDMLCLIGERRKDLVLKVTRKQLGYWRDRSIDSVTEFRPLDDALREANAPNFAETVNRALKHLAMSGQY